MKVRLAAPLTVDSIVDGPGLRIVLWTQGCPHRCEGCHNPKTHLLLGGFDVSCEELIAQIRSTRLQKGLTLSGGEPFLQAGALLPIVLEAKQMGLDVWAYTGYEWEALLNERNRHYDDRIELLKHIDVLIDGRFVQECKSHELRFRGSSNQRIIDVQQSLASETVVLLEAYMS